MTDATTVGERPGRSGRLTEALVAFASRPVAGESGLLDELPMDAVLARAGRDELEPAAGRLLELMVSGQADLDQAVDAMTLIASHHWADHARRQLESVLDSWWAEALNLDAGEQEAGYRAADVLGVIAGYDAPMVRWLEPWLVSLDGPGSVHLVDIVLDGLPGPAWADKPDEASQVFGWARTEPVINGLILIGATHVAPDRMSDALDRLI